MVLVHKLAKLAHQTFHHITKYDKKVCADSLNSLVAVVNSIRKADVGLISDYLTDNVWTENSKEAPVTYIDIIHNDVFTVGIFIVKQGAQIPLHDHPGMYGIIKVLHGKVCVQSYTRTDAKQSGDTKLIPVVKNDCVYVGEDDAPGILTPFDSNLHEIRADGGVAAFLDVLAPPYDSARDCHYYEEVVLNKVDDSSPRDLHLREIPPPETYWSDGKRYLGPRLQLSGIL